METFCKEFQTVVACLQIKRDNKALECVSKISVFSIGASAEAQYSQLLTPYAANFVREQLEKRTKVKMVDGKVTTAETSLDECSCKLHQTMKLPCKHIFALRESSHQPLFEERLTHNRWRLDNYKKLILMKSLMWRLRVVVGIMKLQLLCQPIKYINPFIFKPFLAEVLEQILLFSRRCIKGSATPDYTSNGLPNSSTQAGIIYSALKAVSKAMPVIIKLVSRCQPAFFRFLFVVAEKRVW